MPAAGPAAARDVGVIGAGAAARKRVARIRKAEEADRCAARRRRAERAPCAAPGRRPVAVARSGREPGEMELVAPSVSAGDFTLAGTGRGRHVHAEFDLCRKGASDGIEIPYRHGARRISPAVPVGTGLRDRPDPHPEPFRRVGCARVSPHLLPEEEPGAYRACEEQERGHDLQRGARPCAASAVRVTGGEYGYNETEKPGRGRQSQEQERVGTVGGPQVQGDDPGSGYARHDENVDYACCSTDEVESGVTEPPGWREYHGAASFFPGESAGRLQRIDSHACEIVVNRILGLKKHWK